MAKKVKIKEIKSKVKVTEVKKESALEKEIRNNQGTKLVSLPQSIAKSLDSGLKSDEVVVEQARVEEPVESPRETAREEREVFSYDVRSDLGDRSKYDAVTNFDDSLKNREREFQREKSVFLDNQASDLRDHSAGINFGTEKPDNNYDPNSAMKKRKNLF